MVGVADAMVDARCMCGVDEYIGVPEFKFSYIEAHLTKFDSVCGFFLCRMSITDESIIVSVPHKEPHGTLESSYVKSIVFGGLDGIITTFSIVAAVAGASLSEEIVILMGFANLLSDGISMGLGDYLSESAELQYIRSERAREEWEFDTKPEAELQEMLDIYKEKGVADADAQTILQTMMKYKNLYLDHMMVLELGLQSPGDDENPAKNGLITFGSFVAFGSVPMWVYVILWGSGYSDKQGTFGIACAFTALTMFLLGSTQARITKQNVLKTGGSMMLNGCLAAAAAYLIGWGLEHAIGKGESEC